MSASDIEKSVQEAKPSAPRVTLEHIESIIVDETYTVLPSGKVLVCELTLRNGYTVRGEASSVSKDNFKREIGEPIARDRAVQQIWQLEGYLLQEKLFHGE